MSGLIAVGIFIGLVLIMSGVALVVTAPSFNASRGISDRHKHRWSQWKITHEKEVHVYGEVDEGREVPDRIDVSLRRACVRCGLPQTQTVRGLDSTWKTWIQIEK